MVLFLESKHIHDTQEIQQMLENPYSHRVLRPWETQTEIQGADWNDDSGNVQAYTQGEVLDV